MWRVGSLLQTAAAEGGTSTDDEEAQRVMWGGGGEGCADSRVGQPARANRGDGVMVCAGDSAYHDDVEAGSHSPAPEGARCERQHFSNLPTLPARRALRSGQHGLVDNSHDVGVRQEVVGSHFGVADTWPSAEAGFSVIGDVISANKPVQTSRLATLGKLADPDASPASADAVRATRSKVWAGPYVPPSAPGSNERGKIVLAPASLKAHTPKARRKSRSPARSPASSGRDDTDDDGSSRPTSESFCSSSCGSESGSEYSSDADSDSAAGAGVGTLSQGAPRPARPHGKSFCLGIRWFIRNNKLVVGSFSGWSVADKMGVKHGDILRAVDGVDVLAMAADSNGNHPAMDLLKGKYGTQCALHLMRVDVSQVKDMMNRPAATGKDKLVLNDVHTVVPRLIADDA